MFISSRRSIVARSKTFVAALLTTALAVSMLSVTVGVAPAAMAAEAGTGTVSGKVFQNYASDPWDAPVNADQGRSASKPLAGITATAYDATGEAVGSAQSAADGTYKINVNGAYSSDLRIEFSGWSAPFEPAFAVESLTGAKRASKPAAASGVNSTSVQLVTLDAKKPVTGVDFGLMVPEEVAQPNAPIATSVVSAGGLEGNSASLPSLIAQNWSNSNNVTTKNSTHTLNGLSNLAKFGETGSTWGVAYSSEENALFTAASLKRMSALGEKGLGGIYRTAGALKADGTLNAAAKTQGWLNLQGLPISNSAGKTVDLGASLVPTEAKRDLKVSSDTRREVEAFALAGRVGIGGIAVAPGGSELLAANLYDGDVYAVSIAEEGAPVSAQRIATQVKDTQAIWAVSVYQDRLYIGYVDTGDQAKADIKKDDLADGSLPGTNAKNRGMKAYVVSTSLVDGVAALADTPEWKAELTVDLGYDKGSNIPERKFQDALVSEIYGRSTRWNSWTNVWAWTTGQWHGTTKGTTNKGKTVGLHSTRKADGYLQHYPQPILSGISFDRDGYMILGLSDRTALQAGNKNLAAMSEQDETWFYEKAVNREKPKPVRWSAVSDGDVLVAAPSSKAKSEPYTLESGGAVGDRGARTAVGTPKQPLTSKNGQGPGNGEFFNDSMNLGAPNPSHDEIGLGATFTYPGSTEVASTVIDPGEVLRSSGIMWFDGITGRATRGSTVTQSPDAVGTPSFQKAGGLGGTSLLLAAAPVEIGNRVWLDADLNGRQDADEPAINGAVVELHAVGANGAAGDLIATRTTATIDGQPGTYYFRTDDDDVVTAGDDARSFLANGDYVLVFKKGTESDPVDLVGPNADYAGFAGVTWADLARTSANSADANTANDSNPDPKTGEAPITVGGPGENDHTYDAGWYGVNDYELSKQFDSTSAAPAEGTAYTFNVVGAKNFRGEDVLAVDTLKLTETEFSVSAAQNWAWAATQKLPLGYQLELAEVGVGAESVSWSTPAPADASHGQVNVVPKSTTAARAKITATNHLTEPKKNTFSVRKTVTEYGDLDIDAQQFGFSYRVIAPVVAGAAVPEGTYAAEGTFSLARDEQFESEELLAGSIVEVREDALISTDDVKWGTAAWNVDETPATIVDGWTRFTIPDPKDGVDAPGVEVAVDNKGVETNVFTLQKRFAGEMPAEAVQRDYPVAVQITEPGGTPERFDVNLKGAGELYVHPTALPVGTVVRVHEGEPAPLSGYTWNDPKWFESNNQLTADAGGWAQFVIPETGSSATLVVENSAPSLPGYFQVNKVLSNPDGIEVPAEYTLEYKLNGVVQSDIVLTAGAAPTLSTELGKKTTVSLRERDTTVTNVTWTRTWTMGGKKVTPDSEGWLNFEINSGSTIDLTVENTPTIRTGRFKIDKTIVGDGKDLVPADAEFTVEYREVDTEEWIALDTISKQKLSITSPKFPEDTKIELRESPATAGKTFGWKAPEFSIDGKKLGATASLTIVADTDAPATVVDLKNTAVPKQGTFEVKKTVEGPFDLNSDELNDLTFTVNWAGGGRKGTMLLNKENNWTAAPEGDLFPVDTAITLTEGKIRGKMAPHVVHTNERWLVGADNVKVSGKTATVTIVEDQPDAQPTLVTLRNEFVKRSGSFGVKKEISGTYKASDTEIENLTFQVAYEASTGQMGTIDLNAANGWEAISDQEFPVGTKVTLTEAIVDHETLPGGVKWDGAVWAGGLKQVKVSGDKLSAVVTIEENTPAEAELVSLTNAFTPLTGSFAVQKSVVGDFDLNDPEVRGANFKVAYTAQNGDDITEGTLDLNGGNGWNESSPEFEEGTTVTLTELDPVKLHPSVTWEGYRWANSAGLTVSPDGKTASFTVKKGNAPTMRFELENLLKEKTGGFTLEKQVTGADAELVPDSLEFAVEYSVDGGAVWKKLPAVSKAKPTTKSPKDIRLGTTVLIREVAPATVEGVIWGAPEFSGTGVQGGGTGEPASFVVTSQTEPIDVLLKNPTKKGLPTTGAASSVFGAMMGGLLLLAGALLIVARRLRGSRVHKQRQL